MPVCLVMVDGHGRWLGGADGNVIIQFGKVGECSYTLDFTSPVSAFQAFAIALTQFEN
eukprot:SAG11_NODE_743_length_7407_cov_2.941434_7_plen_58_part_00